MKVNMEDIIDDVDLSIFDCERILNEFDSEREYATSDYDEDMEYYHMMMDPISEYEGLDENESLQDCFNKSMHISNVPYELYI